MSASAPRAAPEVANTEDGAGGWPEEQRGSVMGHGSIALFVCVCFIFTVAYGRVIISFCRWEDGGVDR